MLSMRSRFVLVIGVLAILLASQVFATVAQGSPKILEWDTMVGVPTGLTGAQSQEPLRGLNGGGVAWTLTAANGELSTSGKLEIEVTGLVVASTLSNPASAFRATVSCLNASGTPVNVPTTDTFPATTGPASSGGGNSKIEATLTLPSPCIAPIVFVTSTGGSWFAATGN
jgi:hypothetical protein